MSDRAAVEKEIRELHPIFEEMVGVGVEPAELRVIPADDPRHEAMIQERVEWRMGQHEEARVQAERKAAEDADAKAIEDYMQVLDGPAPPSPAQTKRFQQAVARKTLRDMGRA